MLMDNNVVNYLDNCTTIHSNPPFFEEQGLLERLNIYKDLDVAEIFSTNIYPQRIDTNEKQYILWDNNLWDLYGRFLVGISQFTKPNSSAEDIIEHFMGIFLLFLSCRFDRVPALSFLFSDLGVKKNIIIPYSTAEHKQTIDNLTIYENTYFISKWFVFEHEVLHNKYKYDKNLKSKNSSLVLRACKFISMASNHVEFISNNNERNMLASFFSHIKDDERLIEELCCDVFALIKIIQIYANIHTLSLSKSFEECLQAARYIIHFQSILSQIENHWKNAYDFVNKTLLNPIKGYVFEPIESKNSELEVLRANQKTQYNLRQNYTSLITSLVCGYSGIDIEATNYTMDFFSSDAYKSFFVPMLNNTIIKFGFTNEVFLTLVDIYNKASIAECRDKRNQNIGWL